MINLLIGFGLYLNIASICLIGFVIADFYDHFEK